MVSSSKSRLSISSDADSDGEDHLRAIPRSSGGTYAVIDSVGDPVEACRGGGRRAVGDNGVSCEKRGRHITVGMTVDVSRIGAPVNCIGSCDNRGREIPIAA
jgi:hypothetical protein